MKKKLNIENLKVQSFITTDELKSILSGVSNLDPGPDCSSKHGTHVNCVTNEVSCPNGCPTVDCFTINPTDCHSHNNNNFPQDACIPF
jgi:hypothetical protein